MLGDRCEFNSFEFDTLLSPKKSYSTIYACLAASICTVNSLSWCFDELDAYLEGFASAQAASLHEGAVVLSDLDNTSK